MVTPFLQLQLPLGSGSYLLPTSSGNSSLLLLALSTAPVSSWSRKPTPGFHLHKLSPFPCVSARTWTLWTMIFVRSQVGWASYRVWTHIKIWIIKAKNTVGILLNLTVQRYSWHSGIGSWEKKKNPFTRIIQSILDPTTGSKLSHILLGWEWDVSCKGRT